MKIICKSSSQVAGFGIVQKGREIEWPDGINFPPQVIGNFVSAADGTCLKNDDDPSQQTKPGRRKAATLNADKEMIINNTAAIGCVKLAAKLDSLHETYDEKMNATELAKILLRHNGEKID